MALSKSDYLRTEGYDEIADPITGQKAWVDRETGEVKGNVSVDLVEGSIVITPQQQKARERYKQESQRRSYGKTIRKALGRNFTFITCDSQLRALPSTTAVRLTVLSTYAEFDTGILIYRGEPMTLPTIAIVLGISERSTRRFCKSAKDFLSQNDDEQFVISTDYFLKGRLDRRRLMGNRFQQLHDNALCQVYNAVDQRHHRYLGYAFQMLEYLNIEYNFLCYNPEERELSEVIPLTCKEYCKKIGYDYSNFARLKKVYSKLSVQVGDKKEAFCSFVDNGQNTKIFVNPHIVYAGTQYDKVEILGKFCET